MRHGSTEAGRPSAPVSLRTRPAEDPAEIEWVTSASVPERWAAQLPCGLAALVADGTLASVEAGDGAVRTRLAGGRTWREAGPGVRTALVADLWEVADAELETLARSLADGPLRAATGAHGGAITVEGVHRGVVEVSTHGACHGCPAVGLTLGRHFQAELEAHGANVVEVREITGTAVSVADPARSGTGGSRGVRAFRARRSRR